MFSIYEKKKGTLHRKFCGSVPGMYPVQRWYYGGTTVVRTRYKAGTYTVVTVTAGAPKRDFAPCITGPTYSFNAQPC